MSRYSRRQKKRIEKRRRTRRSPKVEKAEKAKKPEKAQQGGGDNIDSIAAWVRLVQQTPAFTKTDDQYKPNPSSPDLQLGSYHLSNLVDPSLTLPPREKNEQGFVSQEGFKVNESDIRDIAATLREQFDSTVNDDPTPYEFMTHITNIQTDPNIDPSILRSIQLAGELETYLQHEATPAKQIDQQKVLTDPQYYPLFFLTLLANTAPREGKDEIPLLVPPTLAQQGGSAI